MNDRDAPGRRSKSRRARAHRPANIGDAERTRLKSVLLGQQDKENNGIACSEPWADEAVNAVDAGGLGDRPPRNLAALARGLLKEAIYPPGGMATGMTVCMECGRHAPAAPCESDLCVDCQSNRTAPRDDEPAARGSDAARTFVERITLIARQQSEEDGREFNGAVELINVHAAAYRLMAQQLARERRMRDVERDDHLAAELARFQAGTWAPEPDPEWLYRARRRRRVAPRASDPKGRER